MNGRGHRRVLAAAAVLLFLAAACGDGADGGNGPVDAPTSVRVALTAEPSGFNVHRREVAGQAARDVTGLVWPSAYRIQPDGSLEPWLLASPAMVVSGDPFQVEWRIRGDAIWSDGTPVSADDFEFLYRHCAGRVRGATCVDAAGYERITRFETVDAHTVRATFAAPFYEYESLFRYVPPSHVAEARVADGLVDDPWGAFADSPGVSAGPMLFERWDRGESMTFTANPDHFGQAPAIDQLTVRFLEPGALSDALRSGDVEVVAAPATFELFDGLERVADVEVDVFTSRIQELLVFNLGHRFLSMPPVRRAITHALDRSLIVDGLVAPVLADPAALDNRVLGLDHPDYQAHGEGFAEPDVALAVSELESAGFVKDEEGVFTLGGERLELRIATTAGNAAREEQVQLIQAQLSEIGIRVSIANEPADILAGLLELGDFDLVSLGRDASTFPASRLAPVYGTRGGDNVSGLAEARVDELLGAALAEPGPVRAEQLNQLDSVLWEFLPDVPLYQPAEILAHAAGLSGVEPNPTRQGHLWNVEEWTVAGDAG